QNLPASNLAALKRRTVVVSDIDDAPELEDPELGTTETLHRLGTKSLVATPMIAFDRSIGVLGLHRAMAGPWSEGEVALIESVARELVRPGPCRPRAPAARACPLGGLRPAAGLGSASCISRLRKRDRGSDDVVGSDSRRPRGGHA